MLPFNNVGGWRVEFIFIIGNGAILKWFYPTKIETIKFGFETNALHLPKLILTKGLIIDQIDKDFYNSIKNKICRAEQTGTYTPSITYI